MCWLSDECMREERPHKKANVTAARPNLHPVTLHFSFVCRFGGCCGRGVLHSRRTSGSVAQSFALGGRGYRVQTRSGARASTSVAADYAQRLKGIPT